MPYVCIDGFETKDGRFYRFECARVDARRWNGFACPYFTKEQGFVVMDAHNHQYDGDTGNTERWVLKYDEKVDAFIYNRVGETDPDEIISFERESDGTYGIGAMGWIWDDATDDMPIYKMVECEHCGESCDRNAHGDAVCRNPKCFYYTPESIDAEIAKTNAVILAGSPAVKKDGRTYEVSVTLTIENAGSAGEAITSAYDIMANDPDLVYTVKDVDSGEVTTAQLL